MKISPQGQIRIPKKVLELLKIVPGDYIEMDVESGHAVLKPGARLTSKTAPLI